MQNTSNLKDTLTTISGLIVAVGGTLLTVKGLPETIQVILGIAIAISVGVIGFFTGKAPDGTAKTNSQLKDQNVQAK